MNSHYEHIQIRSLNSHYEQSDKQTLKVPHFSLPLSLVSLSPLPTPINYTIAASSILETVQIRTQNNHIRMVR